MSRAAMTMSSSAPVVEVAAAVVAAVAAAPGLLGLTPQMICLAAG